MHSFLRPLSNFTKEDIFSTFEDPQEQKGFFLTELQKAIRHRSQL